MSGVEVDHMDGDGLRERRLEKQEAHLNGDTESEEVNKRKRTFGRTSDGTGE